MCKYNILKKIALVMMSIGAFEAVHSQSASTPNSVWYEGECEEESKMYRWPDVPSPCPEVIIKQKGDHHWERAGAHTTLPRYRHEGWDTVVSCENPQIILTCTPNIPARRFNGTYYVDEINYDPADPTFSQGTRMPISTDDNFSNYSTTIPYPFYFFGIQKSSFVLGANGLVAFGPVPVTNSSSTGPSCPWSYSAGLPWTDGTSGAPNNLSYMRDAIYGVYEDTYPSPSVHGSTGDPNWGIYYGVQDEFPCRKIICSWNDVPQFSCTSMRCTYQIVCYEGSNIIEVHVKQRQVCTSWNGGHGIIGIQNATGLAQVASSNPQASNGMTSINGKPAAFYPAGKNPFQTDLSYKAYRFTPQGQTAKTYGWYRISEHVDTIWTDYRLDTIWTDYLLDTTWTDYQLDTTWSSETEYTVDTTWTDYLLDTTWTSYRMDTTWTNYTLNRYTVNDTLRNAEVEVDAMDDSIGYMLPMHDQDETYQCKYLSKAYVSPKRPTKYVFFLNFKNANNDEYILADTIFVGVDTVDYLNLHKAKIEDSNQKRLDVCLDDTARMRVDMNKLQYINHEEWTIFRVAGGDTISLDTIIGEGEPTLSNNYMTIDNYRMVEAFRVTNSDTVVMEPMLYKKADYERVGDTAKTRLVSIHTNRLPNNGLQRNKIDTLIVQITADYESGCHSFDTMMVRIFPKFDTTTVAGICRGEEYVWSANGRTYSESTNPSTTVETLHSAPGCDSVVHLDLTVMDISFTVDPIEDCQPITWLNGQTYSESNTATASSDTVVLQNRWGCDSIVQLQFTLYPLTAILQANIDHFSMDNLDVELSDLSINGGSRVWKFPTGSDQTGETAYYTIPADLDGANILLIESSPFGCIDTAEIYLPLNKESFWVPNAFTPDNPAGNNLFGSVSTKTLRQEMFIYNRRGELVFSCEGADCTWDGRDLRGEPCVQGAYVYVIRYTNEYEPKNTHTLTGAVTLIR